MGTSDVRGDVTKNRLYLVLQGFMTDDEVEAAVKTIMAETKKLKPGFDVVNDISSFKPASAQATAKMADIQRFVKEKGVRRVIRVVGQGGLAATQLARTGKEAGYSADTVATMEDAEKELDKAK